MAAVCSGETAQSHEPLKAKKAAKKKENEGWKNGPLVMIAALSNVELLRVTLPRDAIHQTMFA